ncbi:MAG: DNA polymerase III subunit beta [Sphingomonadales bacterium]|nr:DNA polymerase III subunit beta [Sphingomonadales bacterium]
MASKKGAAIVDREHMLRAALVASSAQSGKDMIPILGNMLVEASAEQLALTGTDMDVAVRLIVPARCEGEPIETTVSAKRLAALAGSSDDDCEIRLSHAAGARDLEMIAGRSRYKLPVTPRADFPLMSFDPGPCTFMVSSSALGSSLSRCAFAEGDNVARYYLCGTSLIALDGAIFAVATDGNILARLTMCDAPSEWPTVILPSKLTVLLIRILKDGAGDVAVTLDAEGKRIRFEWGCWTITSKLIDGQFPSAWSQIIPAPDPDRQVVVDAGTLERAVRRVGEMAEGKTRIIEMLLSADRVTMRCQSIEAGFGEEDLPAACGLEDMTLRFVIHQLRDIVSAASGDSVRMTFGADGRANVRVEPEAGGGFVGVLQPLNL